MYVWVKKYTNGNNNGKYGEENDKGGCKIKKNSKC